MTRSIESPARALGLTALLGASLLTGCEDPSARTRTEVQRTLQDANGTIAVLSAAPSGDAASRAKAEQGLTALISKLQSTDGAAAEQQAAASLLGASAHIALAGFALDDARGIEADLSHRRARIEGLIDAAGQLETLASAMRSISSDAGSAALDSNRQQANDSLRSYSEQMATQDGPISDLTNAIDDDEAEVDQLRRQAEALLRESSEQGRRRGFDSYEQAVEVDRRADLIEHEIGQRQLQLDYTYQPVHDLASAQADHAQNLLGAIASSDSALQAMESSFTDEATALDSRALQFRTDLTAELDAIDQATVGPLNQAYREARTQLTAAANKPMAAARGSDRDMASAARSDIAGAYQQLGRMHWTIAQAQRRHLQLLTRMSSGGPLLSSISNLPARINDAQTAMDEALEEARNSYQQASDLLEQVNSPQGQTQLSQLRQDMKITLASLGVASTGTASPTSVGGAPASPRTTGTSSGATGVSVYGNGAGSPEELVTALTAATGPRDLLNLFVDQAYIPAPSNDARQIIDTAKSVVDALFDLDESLYGRFNEGLLELLLAGAQEMQDNPDAMSGGMGGMMPMDPSEALANLPLDELDPDELRNFKFDSVELTDLSGDRGTITVTAMGESELTDIRQINGRWYIYDRDIAMGMQDAFASDGDPEMAMQMAMTQGMIAQLAPAIKKAIGGLADRVDANEFATMADFQQAGSLVVQQMMEQVFGAMFGDMQIEFDGADMPFDQ